ncbi:2,4-dihydroxyhept-2-ene-1,7-dioic acid aldolase [Pelagibacterales bacterium SAG-MED35]|nr:2,4-dihydroxyhept-2-ene-1,7-dioic acid aldolase [Pelagibacterales bacterium SAG-MED35]
MSLKLYSKVENLKKKIKNNKFTLGGWIQSGSPFVSEVMSNTGYEWLVADLEHGNFSKDNLAECIRGILLGNSIPFVRLKDNSKSEIQDSLDTGAMGLILPNIQSEKELKKSIEHSRWPPYGIRGVGFSRANLFGKLFKNYQKFSNKIIIVAMIESLEAVNNLESICKVKGLDAILIGPYDLSSSLNIPGKFEHKLFKSTLKKIKDICKKNKITIGIHQVFPDYQKLKKLKRDGFSFIPYGMDVTLLQNIK